MRATALPTAVRACLCALPLSLLLLALPGRAAAQCAPTDLTCDDQAPTVTITPAGGSFTGTAGTWLLPVTIGWCDNRGLDEATIRILFDGVDVTAGSTFQPGSKAGCLAFGTSRDALALAPGQHTLQAWIDDLSGLTGSGSAAYTYTQTGGGGGGATYAVQVTPDGFARSVAAQSAATARFTLTNTGTADAVWKVGRTCTAALTGCALTSDTLVSLPAGASTSVGVTFTAGAAGTSGTVKLFAARESVRDSGWVSVGAVTPPDGGFTGDALAQRRIERDVCVTVAAGAGAAYECGDLRLVHPLPGLAVLNRGRAPVLLYNSQQANPRECSKLL